MMSQNAESETLSISLYVSSWVWSSDEIYIAVLSVAVYIPCIMQQMWIGASMLN